MAAELGKIDPMHQFQVEPLFGQDWTIAGHSIAFTNSSLWMLLTLVAVWLFMLGGMKRELVPGRWQAAVEGVTGFITNMMETNIGPAGRKFVPYVFSLFMFILFANMLGLLPVGDHSRRPPLHRHQPPDRHRGAGDRVLRDRAGGRLRQARLPLLQPVRAARRAVVDAADPDPGRIRVVHGPPLQPGAATVRRDDRRPHPAEGAGGLRDQRPQRRGLLGRPGGQPARASS